MSVAPRENKPLGMAIRPEPIPAKTDSNVPTLLLLFEEEPFVSPINSLKVAIHPPIQFV
jgi:hypothetical protein